MTTASADHPAWARPDTHYTLLRDGRGRLTGEVECDPCGCVARDIDDIDHADDCPQV